MEFHHLGLDKNFSLEYQDKSVPIDAKIVEDGGFIIVSTNLGIIRIHKWPPEKQF